MGLFGPTTGGLFGVNTAPGTLGKAYYEDNPQAAYNRALGLGYAQNPRAGFLRGLYPEMYQNYLGSLPSKPEGYGFTDYLSEQSPFLNGYFEQQAPRLRGEQPNYFQGKTRYVL